MTNELLEQARDVVFATSDAWKEFVWEDLPDGFEYVDNEEGDHGRWMQYNVLYFKHTDTGRIFGFSWQAGLTEMQENEGPFSRSDVREYEKVNKTVVVTNYVELPEGDPMSPDDLDDLAIDEFE